MLAGLEPCQGVCTQSTARAGSGAAELIATGLPRSPGQLWPCLAARRVPLPQGTPSEGAVTPELVGTLRQPHTQRPLIRATAMLVTMSPTCLAVNRELVQLKLPEVWLAHNLWSICWLLLLLYIFF